MPKADLRDPAQYYNPMTQAQLQAKLRGGAAAGAAFDWDAYRAAYYGAAGAALPTFACATDGAGNACDVIVSGPAYFEKLTATIAAANVKTVVAYLAPVKIPQKHFFFLD